MPGVIYSGKNGGVSQGVGTPVVYKFGKWTFAMDGDDPEVTNFESDGCYENVDGIDEGTITLEGPYDAGGMPLVRGQLYTFNLKVGGTVTFPVPARVKTITPSQDVKGRASVTVNARTCGVFTAAIT